MRVRQTCLRKSLGKCFSIVLLLFGLRLLWLLSLGHKQAAVIDIEQPEGFPIVLYTIDANNSEFSHSNKDDKFDVKVKTEGRKTLVYVTAKVEKQSEETQTILDEINEFQNIDNIAKHVPSYNTEIKPKKKIINFPPSQQKSDSELRGETFEKLSSSDNARKSSKLNENKLVIHNDKQNHNVVFNDTLIAENNGKFHVSNKSSNEKLVRVDWEGFIKSEASRGQCSAVPAWGQAYQAQISTYDLLDTLVYNTGIGGEYPIPVRGFQEIERDANTTVPLSVILVPFSHADPGYGLTLEEYYRTKTHSTLDLVIQKLYQYPNMTFQWAETVFLARWYQDLNAEGRQKVKELIDRGQLEIVSGGWVMPDEASTTITSVVDQLIEGHQWLQEHLEITPRSAWVNDPFGYSSTFPYLWKSAGMDNMMFLRVNQPLKAKLMEMKSLEFFWRPYWTVSSSSDMLASLMPYTNYWVDDVCGPNPKICSKFNYLHLGEKKRNAIAVTDANVAELATELYQQFRITGDLYKYNTLYLGLGEDFSYTKAKEWDNMYTNYEKLLNYTNGRQDWNINVKFGTVSEYFKKLRENKAKLVARKRSDPVQVQTAEFPTLSGDFFPYTDRQKEFWTGYFTTRPLNKRFSREVESLLRAADIFNVIVYSIFKYYGVPYKAGNEIAAELRSARRELGVFIHHDGITGTSVPHVVRDFERRLVKAYLHSNVAMKKILVSLLSRGKQTAEKLLREEYFKTGSRQLAEKRIFDTSFKDVKLVLVNPLSKRRREVVDVHVNSQFLTVSSPDKPNIVTQVHESVVLNGKAHKTLSFEVELPPFGIEVYTISSKSMSEKTKPSAQQNAAIDSLMIENMNMRIEFSKDTGLMKRIIHKNGKQTALSTEFHSFYSTKGGAYILDADSKEIPFQVSQKYVTVTKGDVMSEVKVSSMGFMHRVRIYNTTGIQGHGIHVSTEIDMAALKLKNVDVVMIIRTDVENGRGFYTDQNNFQLIGRKTRKIISESYYPISSMLVIEDSYKRFTVHCKQPHGGSTLDGAIELMLDRHTFRDDGRGLGQGVYDNVRVNSDFIFHVEFKENPFPRMENRYTYPTEDAVLMNELLQNSVIMYSQDSSDVKFVPKVHPLKTSEFPCDVSIVRLRNLVKENLQYNNTALVLHRRSLHCGFKPQNNQCSKVPVSKPLTVRNLFPKLKVDIIETSLSLVYEKEPLSMDSDIRPNQNELRTFKIRV